MPSAGVSAAVHRSPATIGGVDVLVIGAGAFGLWTARWLLRRGASVTLVDQYGPGNSLSSSGDESRVTRSAHGADDLYPAWQRRSLEQWRALDPALFVRTGVLWLARRDDGFEADALATMGRLGIPAERLDRADRPVAEGRVCQYELTADTHFIIDRVPEHAGIGAWVVGGGSGHGFKHAPVIGEYLSGLITGADVSDIRPPDNRFALRPRTAGIGMRTSGSAPIGS